jgi:RNA polymerase sigma-70 factor (ECF subfamily)
LNISTGPESPFDVLAREREATAVRAAVESLPALYREVVVLCDLQEMDYLTVAHVIQCPIGTVRSRLHRGRALLAKNLRSDVSAQEEVGRKHG